jgi:hypothetical protein
VISHVYFGGTILASHKRDYTDLLQCDDLTGLVRRLMEEQHKSMLDRLKNGEFDQAIASRLDAPEGDPAATDPASLDAAAGDPSPAGAALEADGGAPGRAFGEGIVSQKPLDEVILEYLVEKARGRVRKDAGPEGGTRSSE